VSLALIVSVLLALFGFASGAPARFDADDDARLEPLAATSIIVDRRDDALTMLVTLNAERAAHRLEPLAIDDRLVAIARSHAVDMAERRYFGHDTPEGLSPFARMARAHYRYSYAGENLALDQSEEAAAQALWNSSAHRSNILQPHFARVGIAAIAVRDGELFVQDFSD
jgi:uncharacterized protein YkwD